MSTEAHTQHPKHGWTDHKWEEIEGSRTPAGAQYSCECGGLMSIGPGTILPEKSFEERVNRCRWWQT